MQQPIIGFHKDDEDFWVAELACGHGMHMRHNPPWEEREWVLSPEGRASRLGVIVNCKKCDDEIPAPVADDIVR